MYFALSYYYKCIITLTDFNTVSFKNGKIWMWPLSTNYLQTLISLSTTKMVRLIPVLSFRILRNKLLESFVACLNPNPDTINWRISIGLLRIREIPGTLFSNFYLKLSSPDRAHALCGVFCPQTHPFDQETDWGHILFCCEQKLLATHLLGDKLVKISKISAGKTIPFLQVLYHILYHSCLAF